MPTAFKPHVKLHFLTGRPRVQTKWVFGKRERFRWAVFAVKYAIFLGLPWLTVGGAPALFFDMPNRRYHVFGQVFWPQDFYLLGLFLAIAAVMLFFSTTLAARSWCGFACPQTLLTHLFMLIDHWVEGDRPARLALDGGKAGAGLWARRLLKHGIWLGISALLGLTFSWYFAGLPPYSWALVAGVTYLFAGHLRDWVCTTVCPYGRFQGAMQDADSLLVTYDAARGEPRGKSREIVARGGCVECNQCIAACPMGIDIRKGPQYECISCQRCLDACNLTMQRIGAAPDLIRMASLREVESGVIPATRGAKHWLRPRVLWYVAVLAALVGTLATLVVMRPLLGLEATRDVRRVFALPGDRTSDFYTLTLLNKDTRPQTVSVTLEGLDAQLVGVTERLVLPPGELTTVAASVVARRVAAGPRPFSFILSDAQGRRAGVAHATFVEDLQ